jgi:hypothetical protein
MNQGISFRWHRGLAGAAVLALVLGMAAGCKNQQQAARNDQQISADVQAKIKGESALSGQNIQVSIADGVATLSGSVTDEASRALAGNDIGTVSGVKTVVNNLTVEPPQQAAAPEPHSPAPPPARASRGDARSHRDRGVENQPSPQAQGSAQTASQSAPAPVALPPPPKPQVKVVTLPAGTALQVRLAEALDSKTAQPNDVFHGALASDIGTQGVIAVPRGTPVLGRISDAKEAAHFKGSALLSLELTELTVNGKKVAVSTDTFSKEGAGRGKNTAVKAGGGAALGAIIGAIAGGGKGAAIGAATGGAAGTGINAVTRGQEVVIPSETVINFQLQSPITVSVTGGGNVYDDANGPQLQHR